MAYDFDLVVIGAGPAGERGAATAGAWDKRVAVVERADEPGGACVHTGTLPSKTLREVALTLAGFQARRLTGLEVRVNRETAVPSLMSRKDAVRESEVARIRWNLNRHNVTLMQGAARLSGDHKVTVTRGDIERTVTSEFVLLATGSRPFHPANVPFEDPDVDDSDSILLMDVLPERLTVIGGGVIGTEYASIFATMGCKVTVLEGRPVMLPFLDREISDRLRQALTTLGVELRLGVPYTKVERVGREIVTTLQDGTTVTADRVLFAAGRSGDTSELGLESVGLKTDPRGTVTVDGTYRTSVPWIFAAGDVVGNPGLASTSMEQARVAVTHAFGRHEIERVDNLLPYGIYSVPEVSAVGESEESCKAKGMAYEVGRALYRDNPRGKIIGDLDGVVKLVFDAAEPHRLLGVHILGERATELVHIGQTALHLGGTLRDMMDMVFNYPTLSETYKAAAFDAMRRLGRHHKG